MPKHIQIILRYGFPSFPSFPNLYINGLLMFKMVRNVFLLWKYDWQEKGVILIQLEDKLKEQQDVQGGHCGVEMCRTELNHEFDWYVHKYNTMSGM